MEDIKKDILAENEDILKNISQKINFLENKVQYLIDENAELKNRFKEASLENRKLDLILQKISHVEKSNGLISRRDETIETKEAIVCEEVDTIDSYLEPLEVETKLKEGMSYLERYKNNEDLMLAVDALGEASDLGSVKASALLGEIYYSNKVYEDIDLAIEYYKRGAEGKNKDCIERLIEIYENKASAGEYIYYHYLGDIYFKGEFVKKDREKYMEYYLLGAEKDVKESINKLINIYKELSTLNDQEAAFNLGDIYNNGEWVERDIEEAFDWYNKAEKDGSTEARVEAASLALEIGDELYEEEDIKCVEWYGIAANKENRDAQYKLGQMFERGILVESDEFRALELYEKAAKNGNIKAITRVKIIKPVTNLFSNNKG